MKRNIIIAAIIGILATYLPFWEWGGTQLFGAFALSVVAWMLIQGTEPVTKMDPESGSSSGSGVQWTKTVYHPFIVEEKERKINENIKNFSR